MITLKSFSSIGYGLCALAFATGCASANAAGGTSPTPPSAAAASAAAHSPSWSGTGPKVHHCIDGEAMCFDVPPSWKVETGATVGGGRVATFSKDDVVMRVVTGEKPHAWGCDDENSRPVEVLDQAKLRVKNSVEVLRTIEYVQQVRDRFNAGYMSLGKLGAQLRVGTQKACPVAFFGTTSAAGSLSASIQVDVGTFPSREAAVTALSRGAGAEARAIVKSISDH